MTAEPHAAPDPERPGVSAETPPFTDRPIGPLRRVVPVIAPAMPLFVAAWFVLATVPLGGPGERAVIWLTALALPLGVLLWISAALMRMDVVCHRPRVSSAASTWSVLAAWGCALVLGAFLPDKIDGRGQSQFTAAVGGQDYVGLSAGFANTVGVLTFVAAVAAVISTAIDLRGTRARLRGQAPELDPEQEDRMREAWVESFGGAGGHESSARGGGNR